MGPAWQRLSGARAGEGFQVLLKIQLDQELAYKQFKIILDYSKNCKSSFKYISKSIECFLLNSGAFNGRGVNVQNNVFNYFLFLLAIHKQNQEISFCAYSGLYFPGRGHVLFRCFHTLTGLRTLFMFLFLDILWNSMSPFTLQGHIFQCS